MTSVTPVTIALNPRRKAHCVPLARKTQKHSGWLAHSYASRRGQMGKRVKVPSGDGSFCTFCAFCSLNCTFTT